MSKYEPCITCQGHRLNFMDDTGAVRLHGCARTEHPAEDTVSGNEWRALTPCIEVRRVFPICPLRNMQ
ncbi:hypothetical protein SMA75_20165 [Escherichia coli]|uniref:hypothetical protein n=1 Tax=Escherichia coli TaxID=562 RepID=UPI00307A2045